MKARSSTIGLIVTGVLLVVGCSGGGDGGGDTKPSALDRAIALRAEGATATVCAATLSHEYGLEETPCISVLFDAGYSSTEIAEALLGYYGRTPSEAAARLSESIHLTDFECIKALSDLGVPLQDLYEASKHGLQIADARDIETILEGLGYEEDEVLRLTAFPTVQRFAPVLGFDSEFKGLPMSAQEYFANMMEPKADPSAMTMWWQSQFDYDDGPPKSAALGIIEVCGRDDCDNGMSNGDLGKVLRGEIPTYYDVIREPGTGRLRITYWWFYGFQYPCNILPGFVIPNTPDYRHLKGDGAHHGDWEPLAVTTSASRHAIEAVTFGQHGGWYTRKPPFFETSGERPRAYVAKFAHGLYHDRCQWPECQGVTGVQCGYYADFRNPPEGYWWETSGNLVSLIGRATEPWVAAEKYNGAHPYSGQEFTVKRWFWGTLMSYCPDVMIFGVCTTQWWHNPIYGHPTLERNIPIGNPPVYDGQRFNWDMASYDGDSGRQRDQGW